MQDYLSQHSSCENADEASQMPDSHRERDTEDRRTLVLEALVRELGTAVVMFDSGYYIPKTGTLIDDNTAADMVANPHLMDKLKAKIRRASVG
jgi:hypothetical protein